MQHQILKFVKKNLQLFTNFAEELFIFDELLQLLQDSLLKLVFSNHELSSFDICLEPGIDSAFAKFTYFQKYCAIFKLLSTLIIFLIEIYLTLSHPSFKNCSTMISR